MYENQCHLKDFSQISCRSLFSLASYHTTLENYLVYLMEQCFVSPAPYPILKKKFFFCLFVCKRILVVGSWLLCSCNFQGFQSLNLALIHALEVLLVSTYSHLWWTSWSYCCMSKDDFSYWPLFSGKSWLLSLHLKLAGKLAKSIILWIIQICILGCEQMSLGTFCILTGKGSPKQSF